MEEALIRVKDLCKIYNPGEKLIRGSVLLLSDSQVRESLHL